MPIDVLVREATGLPEEYVNMAVNYIQYLQFRAGITTSPIIVTENVSGKSHADSGVSGNPAKPSRRLGILSDKFQFIADDFDETPDCFAEYL